MKSTLKSRKLLLFIGLALLAILVLGAAWLVFGEHDKPPTKAETTDIVSELQVKAQEASDGGDVEGGLRLYDEGIEASGDQETKQNLLVSKAYFASKNARHDEAIEIAKSADAAGSTPMTIVALARIYAANGSNEEAANEYQRLLDIIGPNVEGRNGSQDLKSEIERLRSL